jgi:DNA repair exonuclease SbcCD ATPase subunit
MKTFAIAFAVLVTVWFSVSNSEAQQSLDALTQIDKLKTNIEKQIERIKATRDLTDSQLSLARLRIGEQIRRSEEDLALQVEQLQRLREQLQEQRTVADQTVTRMKNDVLNISTSALENVEDQLKQTANLLERMKRIREEMTGEKNLVLTPETSEKGVDQSLYEPAVSTPSIPTWTPATNDDQNVVPSITVSPGPSVPETPSASPPTGGG